MKGLTIGELATQGEVGVETIRYYERRGILEQPPRRPSRYREYPPGTARLIRFIKRAQELGFTLAEIQDLLRLREGGGASCAEVRAAAVAKIEAIERKIRSLSAIKRALRVLVKSCITEASTRKCPILEAFDNENRAVRRVRQPHALTGRFINQEDRRRGGAR